MEQSQKMKPEAVQGLFGTGGDVMWLVPAVLYCMVLSYTVLVHYRKSGVQQCGKSFNTLPRLLIFCHLLSNMVNTRLNYSFNTVWHSLI